MSDPHTEEKNLRNKIKSEKNPKKKDKLKAELELAEKIGRRKNKPIHQELQTIKTQKRFDKHSESKKVDVIGEDKLTTDFQSGKKYGQTDLLKSGYNYKID